MSFDPTGIRAGRSPRVRRSSSEETIRALLKRCSSRSFDHQRDTAAIVRVFLACGWSPQSLSGSYSPRGISTLVLQVTPTSCWATFFVARLIEQRDLGPIAGHAPDGSWS
jgi:hypothetical protein